MIIMAVCSVCECGLSDAISVSRYLHNVLQTKWLTLDAYDCCNWHPLYPGTHSNDDNDGHLFQGRIHPPDVWAWSALSSVPRASDHLTTHRCFVSRVHLLVQACLALGTSGWGKGQTWKVLLESSLSSLWEHASLLSSLAAAQPCDGRWLFCHNLPVFPHHYRTRLLLIWDNPALARHYQFSAKVHRILRYSRPQVVLISLKMFSF